VVDRTICACGRRPETVAGRSSRLELVLGFGRGRLTGGGGGRGGSRRLPALPGL